ncbi:hypothetical protein M427DRAFT_136019 [Gonapodya prolifera JEL478]|uniref:ABM domain-containing protein n=1 Tax=Gonapodya prolifera (strain JEL478) TaxID=1344416 RepID=A0A139ABX7_GONPJ|nr:hypothetical protein M427DRAFT_136019 [Gonapodya prolifera JEL478]|eukprot:KXS14159.1 hypothetical protein M427DRAFT_136019 [Gonapodya prolifera JEL478]
MPSASRPAPPYYAAIFTSRRRKQVRGKSDGYDLMSAEMANLVSSQSGFLGSESARRPDGVGITVAFFKDEASILAWRNNPDHSVAQRLGREKFYDEYELTIAKVERSYGWKWEGVEAKAKI